MCKPATVPHPTIDEIEAFVRYAAPLAWPDGVGPASGERLPGFYEMAIALDEFRFIDLFGGARTDVGFEVVMHSDRLVWGASYRGGLHDRRVELHDAYAFLGRALGARDGAALPVRGPAEYREDDSPIVYRHELVGDFAGFTSLERMYVDEEPFYERVTVGGVAGDDASYHHWIRVPELP